MTPDPDEHHDQPAATPPGPPQRTVPLTRRHATDSPAPSCPDPAALEQDGVDRFWRERRRAGRLLWWLIALSVVVQVLGLLLPEGAGVFAGALVLAPTPRCC